MGDDDDGDAHGLVDGPQQLQDGAGGIGVQGAGGLIAQQILGIGGQGPGDSNPLLLAAGELGGELVRLVLQTHQLQKISGPLLRLPLLYAGDLQREAHVLQHTSLLQQVEALEDHGNTSAHFQQLRLRQGGHVPAVDDDLAGAGPLQQVDAADEGAFAGAGKADDTENLAVVDGKVDIPQGFHGTGSALKGLGEFLQLYHCLCPFSFLLRNGQ